MSQTKLFMRVSRQTTPQVREISTHEFISIPITERPVLLDVRSEDEWENGHAEGAVFLTHGQGHDDVYEIVPNHTTPIVCCCSDGEASKRVAAELIKLGYTHVAFLSGGFQAWLSAQEPVLKPLIGGTRPT